MFCFRNVQSSFGFGKSNPLVIIVRKGSEGGLIANSIDVIIYIICAGAQAIRDVWTQSLLSRLLSFSLSLQPHHRHGDTHEQESNRLDIKTFKAQKNERRNSSGESSERERRRHGEGLRLNRRLTRRIWYYLQIGGGIMAKGEQKEEQKVSKSRQKHPEEGPEQQEPTNEVF